MSEPTCIDIIQHCRVLSKESFVFDTQTTSDVVWLNTSYSEVSCVPTRNYICVYSNTLW